MLDNFIKYFYITIEKYQKYICITIVVTVQTPK